MGGNDRAVIGMSVEKLTCPRENIVGRAKVKDDQKVIDLSDREGVVGVTDRFFIEEAAVFFNELIVVTRFRGVCIVEKLLASAVDTVVVAGGEGVGNIAVESVGLAENGYPFLGTV